MNEYIKINMGCCHTKEGEYQCDLCGKQICNLFNKEKYDLYAYEDFIHYAKYKRCKKCYEFMNDTKKASLLK